MTIKITPLGAGQDVGRSCILLSINDKNIMLDCGMHMGFQDNRRYPDFSYLSTQGSFDQVLDCIIISHFHLDHCGALPYFTEICGYTGPIYMTHPTKAIAPILLEDMRRVMVDKKGEVNFFTAADVRNCMRKVTGVDLHEVIKVDEDIEIKAYYAGHVLGAALFHVKVTNEFGASETCVYTGDYNMTPDRHLGSAWIDECEPDLLITESTYATTIRDSKRSRERDFLKKGTFLTHVVHDVVAKGGKVLVPVFALGRAQELLILIESYWERMSDLNHVPVYFSAGLTERANDYYKLFISWTNEKIKTTFVDHNMFEFKKVSTWKQEYGDAAGPMVLFASPGMLHAGTSLAVFTKWCHDPLNMIIMPGYCVAGTVGAKVLAGEKSIEIDRHKTVVVNMQVKNLSFSAHADAKGILALVAMCRPRNVMLVHGEKGKMEVLKARVEREVGVHCYTPANGETVTIAVEPDVPILVDDDRVREIYQKMADKYCTVSEVAIDGCIMLEEGKNKKKGLRLVSNEEAGQRFGYIPPSLVTQVRRPFPALLLFPRLSRENWKVVVLEATFQWLKGNFRVGSEVKMEEGMVRVCGRITVQLEDDCAFLVSWENTASLDAVDVLSALQLLNLSKIVINAPNEIFS